MKAAGKALRDKQGLFLPGTPRPEGAGRKKGVRDRQDSKVKAARKRAEKARYTAKSWLATANIIDVLKAPAGFKSVLPDLSTWRRWIVFLKAVYGIRFTKPELAIFQHHTGRAKPLAKGYAEAVAIVGRQSGKSRIASIIAMYEALTAKPEAAQGERFALLIAQDHRSALRTVFRYAVAPFESVAKLNRHVYSLKAEVLELQNGVSIAGYPCRPQAPRGLRAVVAVLDELAFFISTEGFPRDVEMLRSVRFCLANTGGKLIALSSPYAQSGAVYDLHRDYYGKDGAETLVWVGSSTEMNPTLPKNYLARMERADPLAYRSEVLGEFRTGLSTLFDPQRLEDCVRRAPLVPEGLSDGVHRYAFVDVSGGRKDAASLAISYREGERIIVQGAQRWRAPHNPSSVIGEMAAVLRSYQIHTVTGDRYAGEWPRQEFQKHNIFYQVAAKDKSALYIEMLMHVNSGRVELPDNADLLRELRGLERRSGTTKDRVDHRLGYHDDMANSCAGAVSLASSFPVAATIPEMKDDRPARDESMPNVPDIDVVGVFGSGGVYGPPAELETAEGEYVDEDGFVGGVRPGW